MRFYALWEQVSGGWDEHTRDWVERHRCEVTADGKRIVLYHGTTARNARAIRSSGFFRTNTFFTTDASHAAYEGGRHGQKPVVLRVEVDPMLLWLGVHAQAKVEVPFVAA